MSSEVYKSEQYELILVIVNRGFADDVMDAARGAGAHGGTVFLARGTGSRETQKFFGMTIQPEKEIVMILVPRQKRRDIMRAVSAGAGLNREGRGMAISLPVDDIAGVVRMMSEE
ncbi:MAG: P-II family nitrogen regulator [Clostridia bacterium]|jgi:nitrogen regulatory protein PII|nr:P-II family nitrogen regulator [Clostridia bacterium]MBQ1375139.1 P-II family nitrogen regulator [Clostridia bacterium]MBQ1434459.1 P-II family nitrogen regulator [Clostridia bacterium]MBQ4249737.1 P-II family nitrogen regulator [Clostridia bacterium]